MGKAVVALAQAFPFALIQAERCQFVVLPLQALVLNRALLGLVLRGIERFLGGLPAVVMLAHLFGQGEAV